jgi:tRNA A37 threonylcarbamoyladenosine synthetase subunit TsaC/SUA5/YrdC
MAHWPYSYSLVLPSFLQQCLDWFVALPGGTHSTVTLHCPRSPMFVHLCNILGLL